MIDATIKSDILDTARNEHSTHEHVACIGVSLAVCAKIAGNRRRILLCGVRRLYIYACDL